MHSVLNIVSENFRDRPISQKSFKNSQLSRKWAFTVRPQLVPLTRSNTFRAMFQVDSSPTVDQAGALDRVHAAAG